SPADGAAPAVRPSARIFDWDGGGDCAGDDIARRQSASECSIRRRSRRQRSPAGRRLRPAPIQNGSPLSESQAASQTSLASIVIAALSTVLLRFACHAGQSPLRRGGALCPGLSATAWTGMPAWKYELDDRQIWMLALFLKHMDKLPPAAETAWELVPEPTPTAAAPPPRPQRRRTRRREKASGPSTVLTLPREGLAQLPRQDLARAGEGQHALDLLDVARLLTECARSGPS